MSKINILYVITKLELGGAQKQLLSLISYLNKDKYTPFLFTASDGLLMTEFFSVPGLQIKKSRFLERPINLFRDVLALYEIFSCIKRNSIDIVHTHSSKAGIIGRLAARLAKVKIIIHTVHGWSFNNYQHFYRRKSFLWLERLAAHFTQKLIVVSAHDKQKGLNYRIGSEEKYIIIRYGIDYKEFEGKCNKIRQELGIDPDDLVVGMVACFKPQKSPLDFIKLAYLIHHNSPRVKFILVGDGVLRKKIERLISNLHLQLQVILTGWRKDISRILSALDIFVLTSRWEGLPVTVLEAIASSKPVVATDTGGISEVVKEGETGFLVSPGDMENMSMKISILLNCEELREKVGQNAKDSLGIGFTLMQMVKNTQELYDSLVKIT